MNINIIQDASVATAPAGFLSALNYAVNYLDAQFTNNITINIAIGWGEVDGQVLPSNALGESIGVYDLVSYASAASTLRARNAPGAGGLPLTSPLAGSLAVTSAQGKALGVLPASAAIDGYVGLSSTLAFSYAAGVTPATGQYYLIGVIEHEITEVMGRVSLLGNQPSYYSLADLFRYSSPGVRDLATGGPGSTAYFSVDGGGANLGTWNNQPGHGDLADWYPSGPAGAADAFNAFTPSGIMGVVSATDITLMRAIGWTTAAVASGPAVVSIVAAPVTGLQAAGASVLITVGLNAIATVSGAPTLTLNDGGLAAYVSGSGTNALTFAYTVGAQDAVVQSLSVLTINGNGGAILDQKGVAFSLSVAEVVQNGPMINPRGVLVNARDFDVYRSRSVAIEAMIASVSNPNGDPISQYRFVDLGPGGGQLSLDGVNQVAGTWVVVAAGALASLRYVGAATPGSELVEVEAFDATAGTWSTYSTVTATTLAPVNVSNSALWVSRNLDALQAGYLDGSLGTITLTDGGTPTLAITASQLANDAGALGVISSAFAILVSGPLGAAAAVGVPAGLRLKLVSGLTVADTAAQVAANLDGLQGLAAAGKLATLTLNDIGMPTLSISAARLSADATTLLMITSPYAIAASGKIGAVAAVKIPAALVARLATGFAVSDLAANVLANLNGLQTLAAAGHLASIALTNSGVPILQITAAKLSSGALALVAITTPIAITPSGTLSAAAAIKLPAKLISDLTIGLTVSDTAANVVTNLAGLQGLAAAGHIASISLTNAGVPILTISAAQLANDPAALERIQTSYLLSVTGVSAAAAATVAGLAHVSLVGIADVVSNVAANVDALQTLATGGKLGAIVLSDGGTPTLAITAAQLANDVGALAKITSAYKISASGVLAVAATVGLPVSLRTKLISGLAVSDTSAAVVAGIDGLQAIASAGRLASIVFTDPGAPVLTLAATQLATDAKAIADIVSPYAVSASGVSSAFNGDSVRNFSLPGSVLDITDLNGAALTATFTENAAGTAGTLAVGDGVHTAKITLFGQFMAAGHSGSAASAGFVATFDGVSGTRLTYDATLAVGH